MSHESVRAIIAAAPEMTTRDAWPEPDMRLITDDRLPAPPLDDDALPAGWGAWITMEAEARACPRDYIAAGLIGAASAWIGNARRVTATPDWIEPAHLWFALIGTPSAGKSPALAPMIEASRVIEREAEPAWQAALARHARDAEVATAIEKQWQDDVRKALSKGSRPADRPAGADAPAAPARPRLMTMDTSTEALQWLLAANHRGLLHVRDELAGWLGGFDRYGGNGADRAFYLECWNGGAYVCDRVKFNGTPVRIEHASLAIIGGMVPDRLREALAEADDGLAARLFYVWPEPRPIAPLKQWGDTEAARRREKLATTTRKLCALAMGSDNNGTPAPRALQLERSAFELFDEQRQEAMRRAQAASGLAAGWHGKNPGRTLRVALAYELLAWAARGDGEPEPTSVAADAVVRAGGYIDYAEAMLERVTGGLAVGRAEADAARVARHLLGIAQGAPPRSRLKPLNERTLYQTRGFPWARDSKRRAEAFMVLQEASWLMPPRGDGHGRPRGDWQVNPRILEAKR